MSIKQYRIRLLELRRKISELIECELALLDEEEIRGAKEANGRPALIEDAKVVELETKGGPEKRD